MPTTRCVLRNFRVAPPTLLAMPVALRARTPKVYASAGIAADGSIVAANVKEGSAGQG